MAHATRGGGIIIIGLTILIALILMLIPLPEWAHSLRPEWLVLVLIYWTMALPHRVGIGTAFCCGLLLDVLRGADAAMYDDKLDKAGRLLRVWQKGAEEKKDLGQTQDSARKEIPDDGAASAGGIAGPGRRTRQADKSKVRKVA